MDLLLLEVTLSGVVLGALMFGFGLLAIHFATSATDVPEPARSELQAPEDLLLAAA
jgi:hypothetical protein